MVEKIAAPAESLRELTELASQSVNHYEIEGMESDASQLQEALNTVMGTLTEHPHKSGEFVGVERQAAETLVAASGWSEYHAGMQSLMRHYDIWG